jgi:hypothetical protein
MEQVTPAAAAQMAWQYAPAADKASLAAVAGSLQGLELVGLPPAGLENTPALVVEYLTELRQVRRLREGRAASDKADQMPLIESALHGG